MKNDQPLNVVGQSVLRRDGMGHVTGKTIYLDDIHFPDMLHLKMVRSPLHHARVRGIDFSEAEKVPGFVRALPADLPYDEIRGHSHEVKAKLGATRPATLGQAGRVEGVTPASLAVLLAWLRKNERAAG